MGIEQRPYVGTWKLNRMKLVQHTPDCLVYINGDTSIPGCQRCSGRIDLQQFITQVTVEAATNPGGGSAQISLALPRHYQESFVRDGQFLLHPGMEVHVYQKGYFPVRGMYQTITKQKPAKKKGDQPLSAIQKIGAENLGLEDMINYPYYHVFHGVVTQVDHSYGGGFWTGTIHCASMLHFWQKHFMSTNASLFGSRPTNSKLRMSLVGHNMTRMTPYEIIYTLFNDTVGAAHGVSFALSSKDNIGSKFADRSMFSVVMEYWKKRFAQGTTNLRMYGVSGVLFSAAQAAFLGRLSATNVLRVLRGRFPAKEIRGTQMNIQSGAQALGLFNSRYIDALNYANRTQGKKKYGNELNIASMQAFVMDIGQFGNINLFESQYQSKLDVAQEVMRVTGFELYQDVDGDIVFKPPMYNLDTSGSRVYRLEDIDIFSISFQEKEPEATYAVCKGSHFKNMKGLGMEGEWGVRGQYIDYRLVAQFGWKPLSFEAAHFNDPRSMFFAAVNRLDLHNASTNTASVQIPLRPEIRPGYPVYIPSLDCFYYVTSVSHSFSFGGQCSTTLQLQGKRAKFYAPGNPALSGIDAIDLTDQTLPKKPLEVAGDGGVPRLAGFPNVVMALDPNRINPLFFVTGAQIENIDSPQTLKNLLQIAESNKVISSVDGIYTITVGKGKKQEVYKFTLDKKNLKGNKGVEVIDLRQAAKAYRKRKTASTKKRTQINIQIAKLIRERKKLESKILRLDAKGKRSPKREQELNAIENKITNLVKARLGEDKKFAAQIAKDKGIQVIQGLLERVRDQYLTSKRYRDLNSTINLLDVLSDKKAAYTNGQVPGSYVYYSASHPNEKYQGQGMDADTNGVQVTKPLLKEPVTVRGFSKNPKAKYANGIKAEAELVDLRVKRGLRVLTNDPKNPIAVLPTSAIKTISFTTHGIKTVRRLINYKPGTVFKSLGKSIEKTVGAILTPKSSPAATDTISAVFQAQYNKLKAWRGVSGPTFPTTITLKGGSAISTNAKFSQITIGKRKNVTQADKVKLVADALALKWRSDADAILKKEYDKVAAVAKTANNKKASKLEQKRLNTVSKAYNRLISSVYRLISKLATKSRFKKSAKILANIREIVVSNRIETPVFPVSDKNGYEVVGTYRYGRDVDIEPNGVFDQLLKQDPTRLLTREEIEKFVDVLTGRRQLYHTVTKTIGKKKVTKQVPYAGEEKQKKLREWVSARMLANAQQNLNRDVLNANIVETSKTDATQLSVGLANWRADAQEGIAKLPVNNAAFSLADLHKHRRKNICSCKRAEANLLIEAFGEDKFVMVTKVPEIGENAGDVDKAVQWLANQIALQEPAWKAHQDALRGARRDPNTKSLADTFKENISRLTNNTATVESAARGIAGDSSALIRQLQLGTGAANNEENQ